MPAGGHCHRRGAQCDVIWGPWPIGWALPRFWGTSLGSRRLFRRPAGAVTGEEVMQMSSSKLRPGRHRRPGKARTTTTAWNVLPGLLRMIVDLVRLATCIDWPW